MPNKYTPIAGMIKYMMTKSARLTKGPKHESDWHFYYDALLIIIATKTKQWMTETEVDNENIMKRWLIP